VTPPANAAALIKESFAIVYSVELLYAEKPLLEKSRLVEAMRNRCGKIDSPVKTFRVMDAEPRVI
jgi:hypothetical protein